MSSQPNHVLILHVPDSEVWCKYMADLFKKNKNFRIHTMDLDAMEYENPPEVSQQIQQSYLVVLLVSSDMLTYMEDKVWLSDALCKVPGTTTVVVALCFVDSNDFQKTVKGSYAASSSWKQFVMGSDQKQNFQNVGEMLDIVDKNEPTPDVPPARKPPTREKTKGPHLRIIPTKGITPDVDVVIAFKEEIKGTIQVSLTDSQRSSTVSKDTPTKYDTKKLNPYTVKFKAPSKPPGNYFLHIYRDATEIHKSPFYYVAPHESAFTSVQYLCQSLQCENTTELDRKLVDILERTVPEDDSLSALFAKMKGNFESGVPKSRLEYPTLLHFAAASGLSDFCSLLLDVPGSQVAFQIENCDGKDPADLAEIYNHPELAQYIRDFMATSYLADACDLYMAMSAQGYDNMENQEPETESFYMAMGGTVPTNMGLQNEEDEQESPYSTALPAVPAPPVQPRASKLPPVPKKAYTRRSADPACPPSYQAPPPPSLSRAQSERKVPPPHPSADRKGQTLPSGISPSGLMGMMETIESQLPKTAMGSTSQGELIEILNGVKEGNFNPNEAVMLFKAWQERNGDGQTKSFKERQKTLRKMRDDYSAMINNVEQTADQMAKNKPSFFSRLISKRKKPIHHVPQISHPVAQRNKGRSSYMPSIKHDRLSNISTTSSSSSSSRESTSSVSNDPYCSSDDSDSGHSDGVEVVLYRRQISGTSSYEGEKRQSRKLDFLEEIKDTEEQPPLPPRTYTRTDISRPAPRPRQLPSPRR